MASQFLSYRQTAAEKARTEDLLQRLPPNRQSILDIGARDGFFSAIFADKFPKVFALDLTPPEFRLPGVTSVQADVTKLPLPDRAVDVAFCAEVLEHVPDVEQACREIARVVRYEAIIGVPFLQDRRVDRTTCRKCKKHSPPWGHLHSFGEERLTSLFRPLRPVSVGFVGTCHERTNGLATALMDFARNPWGSYDQTEPCIHCGAALVAPQDLTLPEKAAAKVSLNLRRLHSRLSQPHANWIHITFRRDDA